MIEKQKEKQKIPRALSIEQKVELGYYPSKEEVYEKYIEENLSAPQCSDFFGMSRTTFDLLKKFFGIQKTQKQMNECKDKVILEKYGIDNVAKSQHSKDKAKNTCREKYGYDSFMKTPDFKEKTKQTLLEKYGVDNIQQVEEIREKTQQTNLEKYGSEFATRSQQVKDKTRETNLKKYGVEYAQQKEEIRAKGETTCLEKYGVKNPFQNEEIKQKIKKRNKEKYGVEFISQSDLIKEKVRQTNLEKYGAEFFIQRNISHLDVWENKEKMTEFLSSLSEKPTVKYLENYFNASGTAVLRKIHGFELDDSIDSFPSRSSYEDEIIKILKNDLGVQQIDLNNRTVLPSGREIDIYLPEYKLGIEFNGVYWHSDAVSKFQDHGGRTKYHQEKSLEAEKQGIFLFHIFEHEWNPIYFGSYSNAKNTKEDIINRLSSLLQKNNKKISARKCVVKEISNQEKKNFLQENHIQGNDRGSNVFLGLHLEDKLVACMCFGHSKFNKYQYELTRFASLHNTTIQGGASKLFRYFVDNYLQTGENIVSYNDITKTKGDIYKILGFNCVSINDPNYWWINLKTGEVRSRYQEQAGGEKQRMHEQGFVRVCDCGTKTWVYTK